MDPLSILDNESNRSYLPKHTYAPEKYLANELIFGNPDSQKYSSATYSEYNDLSSFRNRL